LHLFLLGVKHAAFNGTHDEVGHVKKPEADRKEHQLDQVSHEVVVRLQHITGQVFRPVLYTLFLEFKQEKLYRHRLSQRQQKCIHQHEEKVAL